MNERLRIVVLGLSITSSWGNGHATTYRGLTRALKDRGHDVVFLEYDKPWYAAHRDELGDAFGRVEVYQGVSDLKRRFTQEIRQADLVMVGSFVPEGITIGNWVVDTTEGIPAFYDIDTPETLRALVNGTCEYLSMELVSQYRLYLSFTGGPTLRRIERELKSPMARALYCSFDPALHFPESAEWRWSLGYLGTYSPDRQPPLEALMLKAARQSPDDRFVVAGPQYPDALSWPPNVERVRHLAPADHRAFYNQQRFTMNITRASMIDAGYSPSVRLFEAAACGTPIISDRWHGLETIFLPGSEILLTSSSAETLSYVRDLGEPERRAIGQAARRRALAEHTANHRAEELEEHLEDISRRS